MPVTELLDELFDAVRSGLCLLDAVGIVVRANVEWLKIAGLTNEEAVGRSFWDLFPASPPGLRQMHDEVLLGKTVDVPVHLQLRGGREIWYEGRLAPVRLHDAIGILITASDVTERRRMEEGLRRSTRARRLLTICTQALVHATTEEALFTDVCRATVEAGGYRMCWVGLAEHDFMKTVRPAAHAGHEDGYLSTVQVRWSDTPHGRGPTGTAVRTGSPVFGRDFKAEPGLEPWREEAMRRGYRSCTALPLVHEGQQIGVITMYSAGVEAPDEEERSILVQLSSDLAYGIHSLRHRAARARAEEALSRSEAKLKAITDAIPDPIFLKDREGRLTFANPATLRVFGRTLDQVLGKTDQQLFGDPVVGEALARIDRRIMESDTAEVVEETVQTADGYRLQLATKAPVHDRDGRVIGLVGVGRDITERKRAEEELQESRAKLDLALRSAQMGTWEWEITSDHRRFDDQVCRLLGLDPATFAGSAAEFLAVVHPDEREKLRIAAVRAIDQGLPYDPEYRVVWPDGSIHHVCARGAMIRDGAGRPLRLEGILWDISEHKRAEEALLKSEERFRSLIEKSSDMLMVLDAEGRYTFWSQGSVAVLGWAPEEQCGKSALELIHDDDRQRMAQVLTRLIGRPGETSRERLRCMHKDGTWRHIEATARNLLQDPAVQGVVLNGRDVTEQRRLEDQFRQSQKLESIGRLAGGVAHDFNNLLTVILSCAETLREDVGAGSPVQPDLVDEIRSAGRRAADLTRQLLAFARRQVIAPVSLDLNAVVGGTEKMLRRVLGEDIELSVALAPDLWSVRCDPGQLEQVIMNLAVNARDAMPGGGRFVIATSNVHEATRVAQVPAEQSGDSVMLVVRDSGAGMSPEVKAHAFEPFFTTKPSGTGTGLGLATVYGIIKQSGGQISMTSEEGEGTAFQIILPRTLDAPRPGLAAAPSTTTRGSELILVVEDDTGVREVTVRSLRAAGYRVLVATSGRDALRLNAGELGRVRLLVTDVIMPGVDGPSLAKQLVRRFPELRVLYVSGYTEDALTERNVPASGVELVHKPFTPSSLLGRVRAALDAP